VLARGTLDALDLPVVPVGVGSEASVGAHVLTEVDDDEDDGGGRPRLAPALFSEASNDSAASVTAATPPPPVAATTPVALASAARAAGAAAVRGAALGGGADAADAAAAQAGERKMTFRAVSLAVMAAGRAGFGRAAGGSPNSGRGAGAPPTTTPSSVGGSSVMWGVGGDDASYGAPLNTERTDRTRRSSVSSVGTARGDGGGAVDAGADTFTSTIEALGEGRNYLRRAPDEPDGQALLLRTYEAAEPESLTLLVISKLGDVARFLHEHEARDATRARRRLLGRGVRGRYRRQVHLDIPVPGTPSRPHAARSSPRRMNGS